jgi:hypothetical protein
LSEACNTPQQNIKKGEAVVKQRLHHPPTKHKEGKNSCEVTTAPPTNKIEIREDQW